MSITSRTRGGGALLHPVFLCLSFYAPSNLGSGPGTRSSPYVQFLHCVFLPMGYPLPKPFYHLCLCSPVADRGQEYCDLHQYFPPYGYVGIAQLLMNLIVYTYICVHHPSGRVSPNTPYSAITKIPNIGSIPLHTLDSLIHIVFYMDDSIMVVYIKPEHQHQVSGGTVHSLK